jgi:TRAP-type C4-dicarboxylate transport system substrate-binding protein
MEVEKMKNKVLLILVGLILVIGLIALACQPKTTPATPTTPTTPATPATPAEKPVNLRWQNCWVEGHYLYPSILEMEKEIEGAGVGLTLDMYGEGQLILSTEMPDALPAGLIEGGITNAGLGWPGIIPPLYLMDAPGIFVSYEQLHRLINGEFGDILNKGFLDNNVKVLAWLYTGVYDSNFNNKKLVKLPEDGKGIKWRVPSAANAACVEAMGGSGVIIPASEAYMAIQRGTADGVWGTVIGMVKDLKMYEVAPLHTRLPNVFGYKYPVVINLDFWNSLSPKQQDVLSKAASNLAEKVKPISDVAIDDIWKWVEQQPGQEIYVVPPEDIAKFNDLMAPAVAKLMEEKIPASELAHYMDLFNAAK